MSKRKFWLGFAVQSPVVMSGGTRYCLKSGRSPGLCLVPGRCGELLQSFYGRGLVQLLSL